MTRNDWLKIARVEILLRGLEISAVRLLGPRVIVNCRDEISIAAWVAIFYLPSGINLTNSDCLTEEPMQLKPSRSDFSELEADWGFTEKSHAFEI